MYEADMWNYRQQTEAADVDVTGFGVEAIDGSIGKVDEATYDTDSSSIVVDTGPWIFGKKVLLPAGVVDRIDYDDEKVYVHRTKDQIKNAPEYDESLANDSAYRDNVGSYYGTGSGYRSFDDSPLPR